MQPQFDDLTQTKDPRRFLHTNMRQAQSKTLLSIHDLRYWYYHFHELQSGWTTAQQIQFHKYAITQLQQPRLLTGQLQPYALSSPGPTPVKGPRTTE